MSRQAAERRTDIASRLMSAPPSTVYRAFTDPDAWQVWLPPKGMAGRIDHFDAQPGGTYRMTLTYSDSADAARYGKASDGTDIVEGQFVEFVSSERVVQLVTFQSDDPAFAGEMKMTWSVEPSDGGSFVTFNCEHVPEGISKHDHDEGLRSTLDNLAAFVEASG